jgi:hypothetical protein
MSGRRAGGLERWVPGLRTLREYRRSWLASDLLAGAPGRPAPTVASGPAMCYT